MVQYYYFLAITFMFVLCLYLYVILFLSLCVYSVYFFSHFLVLSPVSSFSLNIPFPLASSPLSLLLSLFTTSFSPLLLNCVQFFNDNANNQDTLSRTEAILMTCLLLPTQHLLCLQVSDSSYPLQSLLNVVNIQQHYCFIKT